MALVIAILKCVCHDLLLVQLGDIEYQSLIFYMECVAFLKLN